MKYTHYFLRVSNFKEEILLRGGECKARVPYFLLSYSSRLFTLEKPYFISDMREIYFLSSYVNVNFIKKDVVITAIIIINIIISFENLSMIYKRYQRLFTSTNSSRNPNTIRLSTLDIVRYLLNQT